MRKIILEFYDNTRTYYYPSKEEATPERVAQDFPIVNVTELKCVIETNASGTILFTSPEPLVDMAAENGLNPEDFATDDELLRAIEDILNAPQPEPSNEPSAEERIADAMEFQNLMNL